MANTVRTKIKRAWNAFFNKDPTSVNYSIGPGYSYRPDRDRFGRNTKRSIIMAVYNRIALDVASTTIQHVQVDENGRYKNQVDSGLNRCLTVEANIDQSYRAFIQDIVISMFTEGVVAITPIDVEIDDTGKADILTMRTGKVLEWFPANVRLRLYNDQNGLKEEVILPKKSVSIVENPFYEVMNEPNGTVQRLLRKMNLLDAIDEQSGSGKLDLLIQLPYTIKSEARKRQADERKQEIERQLVGSKFGIAYIDGTEHVAQLNRSVNNNLMQQIEYLTNLMYAQLNITQEILNGTANEATMLNYYSRTVEPIVSAIVDEMNRKFLQTSGKVNEERIWFFRDPFKLVPVSIVAEMADKFTRNEIMTPNEFRQVIGMKPSGDPKSDELRNRNLNEANPSQDDAMIKEENKREEGDKNQNDN